MLVASLESPELVASPPRAIDFGHSDLPPQQVKAWKCGIFPRRSVKIHRFDDAFVFSRGLVRESSGAFVNFTEPLISQDEVENAKSKSQEVEFVRGNAILCIRPGLTNYGHFMIEMLPNILAIEEAFPGRNFKILFGNVKGPMREVAAQALAALSSRSKEAIFIEEYPVKAERLYVIQDLAVTNEYTSPLVLRTIDRILSNVFQERRLESSKGLFLPRRGRVTRRLENEAEFTDAVRAWGLETYYPEDHTLSEQVARFAQARCVVGILGSALTNIAFCSPGTKVLALAPISMVDTFFWRIACLRSLEYYELRCEENAKSVASRPWNRPIVANIASVKMLAREFE